MTLLDNHENKTQGIHLLSLVLFLQTLMLFSRLAHDNLCGWGRGYCSASHGGQWKMPPPHLQGRLRPETSSVWPSVSLTPGEHLTHPEAWIWRDVSPHCFQEGHVGTSRLNGPCELPDGWFCNCRAFLLLCFSLIIFHFFPSCTFWRIRFRPGIIFLSLGSSVWILDKCFLKIYIFYVLDITPSLTELHMLVFTGLPRCH